MGSEILSSGAIGNLVLAVLLNVISWLIFLKVQKLSRRLESVNTKLQLIGKYIEYSQISNFIMRIMGDVAKFDPDLNEFELETKMNTLNDPEFPYLNTCLPGKKVFRVFRSEDKKDGPPGVQSATATKSDDGGAGAGLMPDSAPAGDKFAKPKDTEKKAGVKDPEYQTLTGLQNENMFGPDKNPDKEKEAPAKKQFKAPEQVQKKDPKDKEYETLANVNNDIFKNAGGGGESAKDGKEEKKEEKKEGGKKKKFEAPKEVAKKDAKDPEYQTLANVNNDIFK